jgi:hypothetical protein
MSSSPAFAGGRTALIQPIINSFAGSEERRLSRGAAAVTTASRLVISRALAVDRHDHRARIAGLAFLESAVHRRFAAADLAISLIV